MKHEAAPGGDTTDERFDAGEVPAPGPAPVLEPGERVTGISGRARWALAAAAVVALVTIAAGCGGGGKKAYALSKTEYAKALDKLCVDATAKLQALAEGGTSAKDVFARKGDEIVSLFKDTAGSMKSLRPPDELKDGAGDFNDNNSQQFDVLKQIAAAAKKGDDAKLTELTGKLDDLNKENNQLALDLGAKKCVS